MGIEIERKFLVTGEGWKADVTSAARLRQAYLANTPAMSVRVRIKDGSAARLTIKSAGAGARRSEFEYEIPVADAEEMLALRIGIVIEKTRHIVPYAGNRWEVDVFEGELAGLVVAEIEHEREGQAIDLPDWLGDEVTLDKRYYNADLAVNGLPRR